MESAHEAFRLEIRFDYIEWRGSFGARRLGRGQLGRDLAWVDADLRAALEVVVHRMRLRCLEEDPTTSLTLGPGGLEPRRCTIRLSSPAKTTAAEWRRRIEERPRASPVEFSDCVCQRGARRRAPIADCGGCTDSDGRNVNDAIDALWPWGRRWVLPTVTCVMPVVPPRTLSARLHIAFSCAAVDERCCDPAPRIAWIDDPIDPAGPIPYMFADVPGAALQAARREGSGGWILLLFPARLRGSGCPPLGARWVAPGETFVGLPAGDLFPLDELLRAFDGEYPVELDC